MKKNRNRFWAACLSSAMILTSLPGSALAVQAAEPEGPVLAHLTFGEGDAALSGGGAKAENHGATIQNGYAYFPGDGYLNVTKEDGSSVLTGKDVFTVSFLSKSEKGEKGWTFYAAPSAEQTKYQYEHYIGALDLTGSLTVERYNCSGQREGAAAKGTSSTDWKAVSIVFDENKTTVYVNGEVGADGEQESSVVLSEMLGDSSIIQLGKANWDNGEFFKGYMDEFSIYDKALSADEVATLSDSMLKIAKQNASETVVSELEKRMLGENESFDKIKKDLTFPAEVSGINFTYKVNGTEIDKDGKVTYTGAEDVKLSVDVTGKVDGNTVVEKNIPMTVLGQGTVLQEAVDALTIEDADSIKGNVQLMKTGKNGVSIDWKSDKPEVITDSGDGLYDGGIVTRPAAGKSDVKVKLTATLTKNGQSKTKEFDVTVKALTANLDTDYTAGYLWTNFGTADGYEQIFYGYSEDGLNWRHLYKDANGKAKPILKNDAEGSDLGVRDPHLIRSPQGDRYWILGTDLHAEGGGPGGSGWNTDSASQNLVVWESDDLVHWSEPKLVFAGLDTAGCVWAPEAIYDEKNGDYMVYWAAKDEKDHGSNNHPLRVYLTRTRDFVHFSQPEVWLDESPISGDGINIIDTTILYDAANKVYYRYSTSDWNTVVDKATDLNGEWTRIVNRGEAESHGLGGHIEGLTGYQLPDGRYCVMGDSSGYTGYATDDLAGNQYKQVSAKFDSKFRHGTVVRLSKAEESRILEAFKDEEKGEVETKHPKADANGLFYSEDFEGSETKNLKLNGSAAVGEENGGHALILDGKNGSFAELPDGWFDGMDTATISFDVKTQMSSGNFFTFAIGQDNNQYMFLRNRGSEIRAALTTGGWQSESEAKTSMETSPVDKWVNVAMVFEGGNLKLYVNGVLAGENTALGTTLDQMGENTKTWFGKSFYNGDEFFNGAFDNIKIYERALSQGEIIKDNNIKLPALSGLSGKDITAIKADIDSENHKITWYVSKNNSKADYTKASVAVKVNLGAEVVKKPAEAVDLNKEFSFSVKDSDGETAEYTVKTVFCNNPVLGGKFADPDVDAFDGKYYIYPTTDGFDGWSGYQFHTFSSEDLVNWTDEGVILDLKANTDEDAGKNEKGVQIAAVPWSDGSAWAPTIEKKNGKYYFYFCGNDKSANSKAIGVAWADSPAGPFTVAEKPLVTMAMCKEAGISMGQTIDPSIYTENGKSYMLFGNGNGKPGIVELGDDMISVKLDTMKNIEGCRDFRESVIVTKRDGLYHFTWSCDDTGSENYHINYGTSESLYGPVTFKKTILQKDRSKDILGTGHHSILQIPGKDQYYIVYHRFLTPLGQISSGFGFNRETCIDKLEFGEDGLMKEVTPTLEGITEPVTYKEGDEQHTHTYANPKWEWSADYKTAKVTLTCECGDTKTVNAVVTSKAQGNDTIYTAAAVIDGQTFTDTKTVKGTSAPDTSAKTDTAKSASNGTVLKSGTVSYKVSNASSATPEVTYNKVSNTKIKSATVPASVKIGGVTYKVTSIAKNAFSGCKKLKTVTIKDNITEIKDNAFKGCTSLRKIVIPKNVTKIGKNVFSGCKKLKTITIKSKSLKKIGKNAFKGINKKATIKVPKSKKKAYKKLFKKKGLPSSVKIK